MLADGTVVECGPAYAGKSGDAEAHHDVRLTAHSASLLQVALLLLSSATSDAQLFWAIRGGGGNCGIVLTFALQLHPQPAEVLSGLLIWPVPAAGENDTIYNRVIQECENFQHEPMRGEETLWVMFAGAKPPSRDFGMVRLFNTGRMLEGKMVGQRSGRVRADVRSTFWCLPSIAGPRQRAGSDSRGSSIRVRPHTYHIVFQTYS